MTLPLPDDPRAPKFWMHETGGKLAPAMQRYLNDEYLAPEDILLIRAYLAQWIQSPVWDINPGHTKETRKRLADLRRRVALICDKSGITDWVLDAVAEGMDPL